MKQAILTFEKAEILLVELPEGVREQAVSSFVEGAAELIGKLSELTEEQFSEICDDNGAFCWDNYKGVPDNRYTCHSARESFLSKLHAEGWYTKNVKPDPNHPKYWDRDPLLRCDLVKDQNEYYRKQPRTFSPEQSFVFKILKQP